MNFTSHKPLMILPNANPKSMPGIPRTKYNGNGSMKVKTLRKTIFVKCFLYFFSPKRLAWYKVKKDKPKHKNAANSFMKSKIMDATLVVITPRKLSWFDIDISPLARYTTTDCVRPKLEIIQNVPANAIRYPISP